ncbi:MAG: elongation factor P [candidate division KSB1 bacterium]|nr:elongation factor P [candidate division KSB1 bacterium]MDZ7295090.1 elongation factor P [candidate division KSB1 bacterium]MDZ7337055.1 elongation factor P [candidate division KSB1 bacterium]MDZ7393961.1 elongation factor P [candidate division KSB1 bacterium]MDZ7414208.1 elongation factor P [candidate division KSB1 bacterium]
MSSISDFRRGMAIKFAGDIYIITEYQHVTPGNLRAFVRTRLKNVKTGRVIENTFRFTDKLEEVRLDRKEMQFLYRDGDHLVFMDPETYDQVTIDADFLGDQLGFLKEGNSATIFYHENQPISAELPITVDLEVTQADPVARGDTAGNLTNTVTLETGARIQVPPFVKAGDVIRIDTRTGKYLSRV